MPEFIGEREIKTFTAEQNGDWIIVDFTNGERVEMSGTLFFYVKTESPIEGTTTTQLVASYFATELLKQLAINRIQLGMLSHVMNAIENLTDAKKERAFTHAFGKKYLLEVGFDQMLAEADASEEQEKAEAENKRLAEAGKENIEKAINELGGEEAKV